MNQRWLIKEAYLLKILSSKFHCGIFEIAPKFYYNWQKKDISFDFITNILIIIPQRKGLLSKANLSFKCFWDILNKGKW